MALSSAFAKTFEIRMLSLKAANLIFQFSSEEGDQVQYKFE